MFAKPLQLQKLKTFTKLKTYLEGIPGVGRVFLLPPLKAFGVLRVYFYRNALYNDGCEGKTEITSEKTKTEHKKKLTHLRSFPLRTFSIGIKNEAPAEAYFERRSCRNFDTHHPNPETIFNFILRGFQNKVICKNSTSLLKNLFYKLYAIIPTHSDYHYKCFYPSPGGLYSIQLYLRCNEKNTFGIPAGTYYFHPLEGALKKITDTTSADTSFSLHLVSHTPTIQPCYGELSNKLSYLEAGHILFLLEQNLSALGISAELTLDMLPTSVLQLGNDYQEILRLTPRPVAEERSQLTTTPPALKFFVFLKENNLLYRIENGQFLKTSYQPSYDLFLNHQGENAAIVKKASFIFFIVGSTEKENAVIAGKIAQQLMMESSPFNLGLCALGAFPIDEHMHEVMGNTVIYALAGGHPLSSNESEKNISRAEPQSTTITTHVTQQIKRFEGISNKIIIKQLE